MTKKSLAAIALTGFAAILLSACAGPAPDSGGTEGDTTAPTRTSITIGNFRDVTGPWDPALSVVGFNGPYMSAVYDPLVRIDEKGETVPALAEKWEYNTDRTELTFHLRNGVTFSDGAVFNAAAAVANINHLREGLMPRDTYKHVTDVTAKDDRTVVLKLNQRDDALLYTMGAGQSWMASPDAIAAGTLTKGPVGSGPYLLDPAKTTAGSQYHFTRSKDHWDAASFPFDEVTIMPMEDPTARMNAMLSGQVDVIFAQAQDVPRAEQEGWNIARQVGNWTGLQFIDRSGTQVAALGDERVRQAINMSFDRAAILQSLNLGAGIATNQIFSATGPVFDESLNKVNAFDLEGAKKLLADAGYADGFEVNMPMAPPFQRFQPVVEQSLGALGITVTWSDMPMPDYQKKAGTFPMMIGVFDLEGNPAATAAKQVFSNQWYNTHAEESVAANPKVSDLRKQINSTTGDEQLKLIKELNRVVTEQAWFGTWMQGDVIYFSASDVQVTPVSGQMFPTLNFITAK